LSRGKMTEIEIIEKTELKDGIISYVRQASPLGLGHAVWCARHLVGNEPFAVLLPDDFCMAETAVMKQMVDLYHQKGGNIVGVVDIPREETSRYGILDIGEDDGKVAEVKGLVEK